MRHIWVIGAGGLLGSALSRSLGASGDTLFIPTWPMAWSDESRLLSQFQASVSTFAAAIGKADTWEIYWAAGVGTMASQSNDLVPETNALAEFLRMVEREASLRTTHGAIALASSAGAIYAGVLEGVINEHMPVAPTTPYAYAKLEQEQLLHAFAGRCRSVRTLVARISTLYGAGQALGKKQGLLTHIARSIVRNKPIQIYVPFDTIRDYIAASDAAIRVITALRDTSGVSNHVVRLVASEHPTTIAEIVATFKRVSRRTPRVVTVVSQDTALYARRVVFRSITAPRPDRLSHTSLIVGIGQLMQAERYFFAQSGRSKS
jgi:UDP-glucose 4-epimerase